VQRVVTDGRRRVLINPALLGACEIDIFAKFSQTLQAKKPDAFINTS
jgi:hypothetical protein